MDIPPVYRGESLLDVDWEACFRQMYVVTHYVHLMTFPVTYPSWSGKGGER